MNPQREPLLLRGGRVVDPASEIDAVLDVLLHQGKVARVQRGIKAPDAREIDVSGLVVAPGFIDMHVHLREPGREDAETIETGTRSAAVGGFTAVAAMPNTDPVNDDQSTTELILKRAAAHGHARVHPIGCVTKGMAGKELAQIGDLVRAGCVAVSDDGRPVSSALVMRRALEYCTALGIPVIDHCEDLTLSAGTSMTEGAVSTALGLRGVPAEAEDLMVERDVRLGRLTGGRVHIAHLSTRGAIDSIRRAREAGLKVTAEVTPHHLLLTDESLAGYDTNFKMNPPLRAAEDAEACVTALAEGLIDCIATDHAPHVREEKNVEFDAAPNGVIGLETAVPVLMDRLVATGRLTLRRLIQSFTSGPAAILGLSGQGHLAEEALADVTVIDPERLVRIDAARFASRSRNTPFDGWRCKGAAVLTVVGGNISHDARNGAGPAA